MEKHQANPASEDDDIYVELRRKKAMLEFHLKAAKAYRDYGKTKQAQSAEKKAKDLRNEIEEIEEVIREVESEYDLTHPTKNNPGPGLVIHMYYAEGEAYWLLAHLEEFSSFERANRQLDEWSAIGRNHGAASFAVYIDRMLVYDGSYDLSVVPADLKRQINLFLAELDTPDAHILLAALAEKNPKLEHGYIDPDTGAWMSKRRFEEGADVSKMSEAIVEDPNSIDDINAALIGGTIGIGTHGLVTATSRERIDTGEGEPEPERVRHRTAIRQRQERLERGRPFAQLTSLFGESSWPPWWRGWTTYEPNINEPDDYVIDLEPGQRKGWSVHGGDWFIFHQADDEFAIVENTSLYHPGTASRPQVIYINTVDQVIERIREMEEFREQQVRPAQQIIVVPPERLSELSISHGLDLGGYEYEPVRNEWLIPLAEAGITYVVEIDADTFGGEVLGSSREAFGQDVHSMELPVVLFTPSGVFAGERPWPHSLPGYYVSVTSGQLNEFDTDCICVGEDIEGTCNRCGGDQSIVHEGGDWALYKLVEPPDEESVEPPEEDEEEEEEEERVVLGNYEMRNVASLAMTIGGSSTFISDEEDESDMQWLREVHLPNLSSNFHSAVLYGNEDSPDRIEVYHSADPRVGTDWPQVWLRKEDAAIEKLNEAYGDHVGLNADWNVRAWHVGPTAHPNLNDGDLYILEIEDQPGDFSLVQRWHEAEGNDVIEEIFEGPAEDVIREAESALVYVREVSGRHAAGRPEQTGEQEPLIDRARRIIANARAELGHDLGGGSVLDLLADNTNASLTEIREVLVELGERPAAERVSETAYSGERRIVVTYEIITEESSREGEAAETGFEDEDGYLISGDDGQYVHDAVGYLKEHDANEPSSSSFYTGIWYSTPDGEHDDRTGGDIYHSYHLKGFSPEEEAAIYKYMINIDDKFEVHWVPDDEHAIYDSTRRVQLYNNGIDVVVALLDIPNAVMFAVFDNNGNEIYADNYNVLYEHADDVLKTIIRFKIDRPLIELGMNRDYLDMLGERIPFVEF